MKCPYCGAPATTEEDEEPEAWLEQDNGYVSLHHYRCLISTEHHFYTQHCLPD